MIREQFDSRSTCSSGLRRVQTSSPANHRERCCGVADRSLRRVLRGRHGRRCLARLIERIDFDEEEEKLARHRSAGGPAPLSAQRKQKAIKRLKIVSAFNRRDENGRRVNDPAPLILEVVPVIPRSCADGAARRWPLRHLRSQRPLPSRINRNNRLKRLLDLGARRSSSTTRAHAAGGRRRAVRQRSPRPAGHRPGNRPLKSLSDMLKGKQAGSARTCSAARRLLRPFVIVVADAQSAPCGLPKLMALELQALRHEEAGRCRAGPEHQVAKRNGRASSPAVWDVLETSSRASVLLNRAPTSTVSASRLPSRCWSMARPCQLHRLVCHAFNRRLRRRQMAVHLPLSAEPRPRAGSSCLSANNVLAPPTAVRWSRRPMDMIIGAAYLTERSRAPMAPVAFFRHLHELERAYEP